MGLFRRLRAGTSSSSTQSGAQADQKSSGGASAKEQQPSGQKFIRRTPSLNLLGGQPRASTASSAPSTPATAAPLQPQRTGGKLPWPSRKKSSEPATAAYEDASTVSPPRPGFSTKAPSVHSQNGRYTPDPTNIPTIATSSYDSPSPKTPARQNYGPRPPSRPPPPSASVHSRPGLTASPGSQGATSNGYAGINVHHRSPSQATVISIDSTFTGGSRSSVEWKQEGGILGKLGFEDDWGGLGDTLPLQNANGQPSAPPQRPKRTDLREDESTTPAAARTSPVKKITTAFSSRAPASTTNVPAAPLVSLPSHVDTTEELDSRSSHQGDPTEEDKRNKMWTRGRKTSRSRASDAPESIPPSSPPKPRRSSSQTGELAPAALRRPSSNLFHNPFGRTTSRSSLPLDQVAASNEDGSFQLKSFRHISGASGADSKLDQYFNLSRSADAPPSSTGTSPSAQPSPRHELPPAPPAHTTPLTAPPPRPRLTSAAGSSSSQQNRVSIAEFRKNVRRPSSSMLADAEGAADDDDLPLSMSRAQLRAEAAIHRNSSAISLGSDAPSPSPSMSRLMPSVSPMGEKERKLPSSSPLSRPQSAFLLGVNDAINEPVKPRRSSNDPDLTRKKERTWPDSPTASEASTAASPTTPTGMREPIRGPRRRDSLKNMRKAPPRAPEPHTMPSNAAAHVLNQTSPNKSSFASVLSDAPAELEGIKLPPRPDEIPDEPVRGSRPPSRSTTLSPGLTAVLDEPLRRISGLWTGNPTADNDDREEAFDPSIIAAIGNGPPPIGMQERQRTASETNRVSIYDRLNSVTSAVSSVVPSPIALMKGEDPNKLYIPPVPDSPEKRLLPQSPASDRTASPVRVAPPMEAPPAPPPTMPHSSFGRPSRKQPEKVRTRKETVGWDTSSEDEDDIKKSSPVIAAPRPLKSAMKHPSRTDLMSASTSPAPITVPVQSSADDSEPDEPLRQVRARASSRQELRSVSRQQEQRPPSRGDMRPTMSRPGSRQDLRVDTGVTKSTVPRGPPSAGMAPSARPNGGRSISSSHVSASSHTTATPRNAGLSSSASKWSLSDSSPTGSEQPSRPPSRPGSRARMQRVASSDRLRAMPGGVRSSHHQTSPPTGGPLAALNNDARHSASPASSQSALTGDSSMQQPSTPRSNSENRRSWGADARLRAVGDSGEPRVRPQSQFDWMNAANGAVPQFPGMDPAASYAQAQAAMVNKQQFYAQWMAAAQAHFDDAWERASNVSNAQTLPGNNPMMGQMPMGYSYGGFPPGSMASMPVPPPAMFNMYGGGYGYGMPAMPFPQGGMSSGMSSASGMGSMGGMGMGGGMYSYAPPAQSVFGGEFGPPVQAPFATEQVAGQGGSSSSPNRRSRHLDSASVRPQSVAARDVATPPRRQQRRASGMALSEVGAPVSAWRGSRYELNEQTPRARRSSHANAS